MTTPTDTAGTGEPGLERTTSTPATPGLAGRTELTVPVDLDHPIWTIQHVSAALYASVDIARGYIYRADFATRSKPYYRLKYRDVVHRR